MSNTVTNVTSGAPNTKGAIYWAPIGTTLPTDATTELADAFKSLGYCSEDGLTNSNSPESDSVKAWGGDTVLTYQTGKEDTFTFTLIEAMNVDVLKAVYGSENVTGTLTTGITVKANGKEPEEAVWVVELNLRENGVRRIVIPDGKLSELGEISYTDEDAVGYELTITAMPDSSGNTHYEYTKRAASGS